jgi:hypothetical protein
MARVDGPGWCRKLVFFGLSGNRVPMNDCCDVCHNFRPAANLRKRTLTAVSFGDDTVVLCEMHRRIAQRSGITTLAQLRELYGESDGRRSYVPRRKQGASAPAAPVESDRRRNGRRATDV